MAPSIEDEGLGGGPAYGQGEARESDLARAADGRGEPRPAEGPDPVIGAGITLLGIFLMGTGGAADAHWVFDFGVLTAMLGAGIFVLFVALSVMRQRRALKEAGEGPAQ